MAYSNSRAEAALGYQESAATRTRAANALPNLNLPIEYTDSSCAACPPQLNISFTVRSIRSGVIHGLSRRIFRARVCRLFLFVLFYVHRWNHHVEKISESAGSSSTEMRWNTAFNVAKTLVVANSLALLLLIWVKFGIIRWNTVSFFSHFLHKWEQKSPTSSKLHILLPLLHYQLRSTEIYTRLAPLRNASLV